MSRSKNQLSQLLFSSSRHDEERTSNHDSHVFENYMDDEEDNHNFLYKVTGDQPWQAGDHEEHQFMQINGPSVEFQNCSQNSLMLSQRQDEDSREYKQDFANSKGSKKREDINFDELYEKELIGARQELQRSQLQQTKLKGMIGSLQMKLRKKEKAIEESQKNMDYLEKEVQRLQEEKTKCFQMMAKKDDFFVQYREGMTKFMGEFEEKEKEVQKQQDIIDDLTREIQTFKDKDCKKCNEQPQSKYNSVDIGVHKKNSYSEKELQRTKKQLSLVKESLEEKESRFRLMEEENRKKIILKERKIQELQQKINQLKQESVKVKTQIQINSQKFTSNLNSKAKEIAVLNQKIQQNQKRIKNLLQDSKKKDEKNRDLSIQLLQITKLHGQKEKERQDMNMKQQFDHHLIEEKDKQIQKLMEERKNMRRQIEQQKIDKSDKLQRGEKIKKDRQLERIKKQYQTLKTQYDHLETANQQLESSLKEFTKKIQEVNKRNQQLKNKYGILENQLKNKSDQSDEQFEQMDKVMRELTDYKKKAESVPQLRNKIIILESRIRQNQSKMKQSYECNDSLDLYDKLQAMQNRLQQKQKQIKMLKQQLKSTSTQDDESNQQFQILQKQLTDREQYIDKLLNDLQKKDQLLQEMKRQLQFKNHTLDYTHNILIKSQKAKIQLEQEKKMLEEKLEREEDDQSFQRENDQINQFYQSKIQSLSNCMLNLEAKLRQKDDHLKSIKEEQRFETRQLKDRIRQLNDLLLQNKQRKIAPQTMSQQDTAAFLIKTIKRVYRSTDMLKLLTRNQQFKQIFSKMQRQLRKA